MAEQQLSLTERFWRGFCEGLIRYRGWWLAAAVVVTAAAWPAAQRLSFSYDLESLFSPHDPPMQAYRRSEKAFGGHELCVVAYRDPHLFTPEGLQRLQRLADALGRLPEVVDVQHLAEVKRYGQQTLLEEVTLRPAQAPEIRDQVVGTEIFRGTLVGADGQTTALFLMLEMDPTQREGLAALMRRLRAILEETGLEYHLGGAPVLLDAVFSYLEEDAWTFQVFTTGLLSLVMLVLFRSLRWVVLPLAVVHMTLVWTKAILAIIQSRLTLVSSMLNALVTIIAIATVIHIVMRYEEEQARGGGVLDILRRTFRVIVPAVFWTSLTTAAGFGSIMIGRLVPVVDFGFMMALGAALTFVVVVMILPGGMLIGRRLLADAHAPPAEVRLGEGLGQAGLWTARHGWIVGAGWAVLLALALGGMTRLTTLSDFTKNFRPDSPVVRSNAFIERRLCGTGPMDVVFPVGRDMTLPQWQTIRQAAAELRALSPDLKVMSLIDVLEYTEAQFSHRGLGRVALAIADLFSQTRPQEGQWLNGRDPNRFLRLVDRLEPNLVRRFWNRQEGLMRIQLLARESLPDDAKVRLIGQTQAVARRHFGPAGEVTGVFVLFSHLVGSLMRDQATTFALAGLCIWIMMAIAFRSAWLGLVALVPNALPIVIVLGTMGWVGLPVNIATAMIASVSMGMAVDSSIHYIYGFRREHRAGAEAREAIRRTHATVGRRLVFANIAILLGFAVLCISNFVPTIHFGILVGVAMFGGLMGNLFILPVLLEILIYFGRIRAEPDASTGEALS